MKKFAIVLLFALSLLESYCIAQIYEQIDGYTLNGFTSSRFVNLNGTSSNITIQIADDFSVPRGENWRIDSVAIEGFYYTPVNVFLNWTLQIFNTVYSTQWGQNVPNNIVYSFTGTPANGLPVSSPLFDIIPPITLSEGQYWASAFVVTSSPDFNNGKWFATKRSAGSAPSGERGNFSVVRDNYGIVVSASYKNVWIPTNVFPLTSFNYTYGLCFSIYGSISAATTAGVTTAGVSTGSVTTGGLSTGGNPVTTNVIASSTTGIQTTTSNLLVTTHGIITTGRYSVVTTASDQNQQSESEDKKSSDQTSTLLIGLVIGVVVLMLILLLAIVALVLRRMRSEKARNSIPLQESPNNRTLVQTTSQTPMLPPETIPIQRSPSVHSSSIYPIQKSPSVHNSVVFPNQNQSLQYMQFQANQNGYASSIQTNNSNSPSNTSLGGVLGGTYMDDNKRLYSFEIDYSELRFESLLGRGNFGTVYKGSWRGGNVAIKKLPQFVAQQDIATLKREADVMTRIRPHVNVVQFLGVTTSPEPCIVTEYMDGGSLFVFLRNNSVIKPEDVKKIVTGIAAGMLHLHSENVVHRDLASRNVLLGTGLQVKISDFGLSRATANANMSNQTIADSGPLKWMAPESLRQKIYNVKTDVWSFGVTLQEIVTHDEPYKGMDHVQVAMGVAREDSPLVLLPPAFCSPIIKDLINQSMNRNPDLRPEFQIITHRVNYSTIEEWMPPRIMGSADNSSSNSINFSSSSFMGSSSLPSSNYAAMPRMPEQK